MTEPRIEIPEPRCAVESCDAPSRSRGWCVKHYTRWKRHGDPTATANTDQDLSLVEAIAARLDIGDCWEWQGGTTGFGYGVFGRRKRGLVHRLLWEELVGPVSEGLELDHLCRNTRCANPDHLEPVTHAENARRGAVGYHTRGQTHCKRGHEFTPENTYTYPNGVRSCRTCNRAQGRRRYREQRAT